MDDVGLQERIDVRLQEREEEMLLQDALRNYQYVRRTVVAATRQVKAAEDRLKIAEDREHTVQWSAYEMLQELQNAIDRLNETEEDPHD